MPTICILYGFCEGPRLAKRFQSILRSQGYQIITDPAAADIIVTHSGGCFLVPEQIRAKQIVHIGISYWPGRNLFGCIATKVKTDAMSNYHGRTLGFWLRKTLWNITYFWSIPRNIRMLRGRKLGVLWHHGVITTVIRPADDEFCTPDLAGLPFTDKPYKLVAVPGHHDQCWREPQPYIDIIVE